ncbi:hypothetical protein ABW21_db0200347 [Orbilia brochopaga]|nr:hypothetical protein ABW21_db0200347 [Drechslerella brochopaga]
MTREYFKEFLEEKDKISPLNFTGNKPQKIAVNQGKKAVLRKWGDIGADIPESTPTSVREAMMDLEKELRKGETPANPNPVLPTQSRGVSQELLASHLLQQPKPATSTVVRAPFSSGFQPTSHRRPTAATQSIMETKLIRKDTPPKHASYEPPRRPYLRPFGTLVEGSKAVDTLQAKKNSIEKGGLRKGLSELMPPVHSHQQGFKSADEHEEHHPTSPLEEDATTDEPRDVSPMPAANYRSAHQESSAVRMPKGTKQSHVTSPFKLSSNFRSPTVASQNATAETGNRQRSISPVRRANARLRPFGGPGPAPDEQMTFAKPRSHRDNPTARFRPFNSSDHVQSLGTAPAGPARAQGSEATASQEEEQDGGPVEQVDLQSARYTLKGKHVEGRPPFRGGWI